MKSIIKNVEVEQKSEYPCLKLHSQLEYNFKPFIGTIELSN